MEQDGGFVKIYRQITKWEWYQDYPTFKVFFHLLITANHRREKWRGIIIGRGQKLTSYSKLALECGLSVRQVRTAISNLKSTGELTYETTSRYGIATINNYGSYQTKGSRDVTQATGRRQSGDRQATTNKNDKKPKNAKKNTVGNADISPAAFLKGVCEMTPEELEAKKAYLRR